MRKKTIKMNNVIFLPVGNPLTAVVDHLGVWHLTEFFGLLTILIGLVLKIKVIPLEFRLLWAYALAWSMVLIEFPFRLFGIYHTAFQAIAGQVFVEALLIPVGAYFFSKEALKALPFVVLFELACVWLGFGGLFLAQSFNSAFCACAIPFLSPWMMIAVIATVLFHHGATAQMIIGAQCLVLLFKNKELRILLIPFIGVLFFAAYAHEQWQIPGGTGRLEVYKENMGFWASQWRYILLGVGPGTFMWFALISRNFVLANNHFIQLHSDWLQLPWEFGLTGLGLTLSACVRALKSAWNDQRLLCALFGCFAFALTYHPLRFFPSALLIAFIFVRSIKKGNHGLI